MGVKGSQRSEGLQGVLGCPLLRGPLNKGPGSADGSFSWCVFLALPVLLPFCTSSLGRGRVAEGLQNSPLWDAEDRRRRMESKGTGGGQQGGLPLAQLPGSGLEEGAAGPSPFPPFCPPPGLLGCRACQLGPRQAKQLPGGEEEAFPSREAPVGSNSSLESPFLTAK